MQPWLLNRKPAKISWRKGQNASTVRTTPVRTTTSNPRFTSPVGGSSGWHSHPGGAIGIVGCAGTGCHSAITIYRSVGGHCVINTYTNGQTFVERPGEVVVAVSTGADTALVYGIFPGVPVGGSPPIDQDDPGTCPGV